MHLGSGSRPSGEAMHNRCVIESAGHGVSRYARGCRCDVCRDAKRVSVAEWNQRHNYWQRPDVVARRKSQRGSTEGRMKERDRYGRYYEENRAAEIRRAGDKWARRKGAPTIQFTLQQLEDRLSMFAGCWMCGCALDGGFHVDHVKPLARGGWHCLSNLRPSCPTCNISKGAKWPLETALVLTSSG